MSNMMSRFNLVLVAMMSLASGLMAQQDARDPERTTVGGQWKADVFPIGFWCGPPPEFVTVARYQQIKDAGFTHVTPSCAGGGSIEQNRNVLDTAQEVGLEAFIYDSRMPIGVPDDATKQRIQGIANDYKSHPALAGYHLFDEPEAGAFPALAQTVAALREADPDHVAYINILPNYAPLDALGTPTYEAHVEQFLQVVRPAILSYDHYSFLLKADRSGFLENLELVRRESMEHQVPFWQIVLLMDHHGVYRRPTEGEKRWEAMQTLAFGGKGLMFFTYWQPAGDPSWGEAVIAFDGTPTAQYDEVSRVNPDVQAIGKYLLPAKSLQVLRDSKRREVNACNDVVRFGGANLTVGVFEHERTCYVLFTNRDYRNGVPVSVSTSTGASLEMLHKATDEWQPVHGDAQPGTTKVRFELAPGDGELFRWTAR